MKKLGQGRSGVVFANDEKPIVHKIFVGSTLANFVHYVFFGAPNAYTWNEDAIRCAHLRRNILKKLTHVWFGNLVDVSDSHCVVWNDEYKAYELQAELVNGRSALLKSSFIENESDQLDFSVFVKDVMKPLQQKLKESGFDGLVWQAGLGNPVAANNFLRTDSSWVWIDLESGVPALIPLDPRPLFSFYLPKSFRHRRALFDDVDIEKLQQYITHDEVKTSLAKEQYDELQTQVLDLKQHQDLWRKQKRIARILMYNLQRQKITKKQWQFFTRFSILWYLREIFRILWLIFSGVTYHLPKTIWNYLRNVDFIRIISKGTKFVFSQRYREKKARDYVRKSIHKWSERKQLRKDHVEVLESEICEGDSSAFITDFGVHVAIKPFVKTFEYIIVPFLLFSGIIQSLSLSVFLILISGPLARSFYTLYRLIQSYIRQQKKPWVALAVGTVPVIGNLAYPAQMLYSASSNDKVATFILYDCVGKFGIYMPIWGGEDTATEHFFNRMLHFILTVLKKS